MTSTEHHYSQQIDEGALIAGRYRLSRWLGLGAMGEVWAARDERLGRDVAVKLVLGDPSTDPEIADRFTREAIAVARINHPNVALVYDQGEYQRHQFVVMELVTGCNLDELRGGRPMPVGAALAVAVQVARALEAAHEVGVLHRDIKPTNIMVSHDGVVKVLDFGITGFLQGAGFTERLTRTGADNLGTAAYTAPERISGRAEDRRSDLYSLGCILYLLLSGLPPFPADDSLTILHRHLHDEPTPLRRWRPELAPQLDQLVLWLLAKEPAARPASAAIVANRLESLALVYPNTDVPGEASLDDLLNATAAQPPLPFTEAELAAAGAGDVPPGSFPGLAADTGPVPGTEATTEFDFVAAEFGRDFEPDRDRDRDRGRERGRDRGRGGSRGGSRSGGGPANQAAGADGYVRTSRRRVAPSLLLVLSVAGGLALGVVVSKQNSGGGTVSAIGAMPSADAAKPTHAAAMGGASAAPMGGGAKNSMNAGGGMAMGSAKASAPSSGMTGTGAGTGNGAGTNTGTGTGAGMGTGTGQGTGTNTGTGTGTGTNPSMTAQAPVQGATSNVTPNAPITPYLRYTAVAPGSGGCVTLAPGQFECTIGQSGGAAVIQAASLNQVGTLQMGAQPFYCQSSGAEFTSHELHNHWWAWTESAQGTWGWVSAVTLTGGANDQPEPGLPYCGN